MSKLIKLEGSQLENYIKKINSHPDVILMLDELVRYEQSKTKDFKVIKAEKCDIGEKTVTFAVLEISSNIKVIVADVDGIFEVNASIITNKNGQEVQNGYVVKNHRIEKTDSVPYDEEFKFIMQKLDEKEISLPSCGELKGNLPCIYGNWCGPGCSGPAAPIDVVDVCCQGHDYCYAREGYFACSCNFALMRCLKPYVDAGNGWAIAVYTYFSGSACIPF